MDTLAVSVAEAGRLTGLGRTKLYQLLADGQIKRVKVGRRTLVTAASLRSLINSDPSAG